jgi:hypothetical protein
MDATSPQHGRRSQRILTVLGSAAVLALAVAPSVDAPQGHGAAFDPVPAWAFADRRALELEALWRPGETTYVMATGRHSTRLLANMLTLHASAAQDGHTGPSRRDERIEPIVRTLTRFPAFQSRSTGRWRLGQHHAPGWLENPAGFPSPQHVSLDAEAASALAAAWRVRDIVGLSADSRRRIRRVVGMTARSRFFRYPSVRLNQFHWNTAMYAADAIVNERVSLLRRDLRLQLVRFVHFARHAHPDGAPNLTRGLGLHYLPQFRAGRGANRMSSSEYGVAIAEGVRDLADAQVAGMRPLDPAQRRLLSAWLRRLLFGEWTHAGLLNWDTGLGFARWQLTRYWILGLGGLSALGETDLLPTTERSWARWMFGRALETYELTQGGERNGCMPSTLFDVRCSFTRRGDSLFIAARIAATAARHAASQTVSVARPPALYTYDSDIRRIAVTTPAYSAAIVDQTFETGYGGVGLARFYDGDGRPLGSIGGRGRWGFGLSVHDRSHGTLLETLPGRRVAKTFRGPRVKRATFRALNVTARVDGSRGAHVIVRHRFTPSAITTSYRIRGPRSAVGVLRLPVWSRSGRASRPRTGRAGDVLTVRVTQAAGGYVARLRARDIRRITWHPATTRSLRSPGTAGVLDVVVALRDGRASLGVTLLPDQPAFQGS